MIKAIIITAIVIAVVIGTMSIMQSNKRMKELDMILREITKEKNKEREAREEADLWFGKKGGEE